MATFSLSCDCGSQVEVSSGDCGRAVLCYSCLRELRIPELFALRVVAVRVHKSVPTEAKLRKRQFGLVTLIGTVATFAVLFALPHQPVFGGIIFVPTFWTTLASRPPATETRGTVIAHDAMIGFAIGLGVSVLGLWLAQFPDVSVERAVSRLLSGPVLSARFGAGLAVIRSRS